MNTTLQQTDSYREVMAWLRGGDTTPDEQMEGQFIDIVAQLLAEMLEKNGIKVAPPSSVCDAYIINTCTVTAESDRKARQFIRRAISKNPSAYVIVTGCLAQTSPETVGAIDVAYRGINSKITPASLHS